MSVLCFEDFKSFWGATMLEIFLHAGDHNQFFLVMREFGLELQKLSDEEIVLGGGLVRLELTQIMGGETTLKDSQ